MKKNLSFLFLTALLAVSLAGCGGGAGGDGYSTCSKTCDGSNSTKSVTCNVTCREGFLADCSCNLDPELAKCSCAQES